MPQFIHNNFIYEIEGGRKHFWWYNKFIPPFMIKDCSTTLIEEYKKELNNYSIYRWKLYVNNIHDNVLVSFIDKNDYLFFKTKWC